MVWPATPSYSTLSKSHFDAGTDSPSSARAQLAGVCDRLNAVQSVVQQIVAHGEPQLQGQGLRRIASGQPLPLSDQGPLWHDDYHSWMTWQVFNANGAAYAGYASVLVGSLLLDTQPTPRAGYVRSGVMDLPSVTYAALRNWAIHHGRRVDESAWAAGTVLVADNADGVTFRLFDLRGEHLRAWDDARGVDPARVFGSWQADGIRAHSHLGVLRRPENGTQRTVDDHRVPGASASSATGDNTNGYVTDAEGIYENRVRTTALLAAIKF